MIAKKAPLLQPDEYLLWEKSQSEKHEYISGVIVAMAGASPRHNRLCVRLLTLLEQALDGSTCLPFPSDQRVRVRETGPFFYPDVSIACRPIIDEDDCLRNAVVVIEVLSPSTDHYDRGEKWSHYRQLPTLRHYVLLSADQPLAEHYSRVSEEQSIWQFVELRGPDAVLDLAAVSVSLTLHELYRRLETPTTEQ